eukprot:jgi/Ulvmu1/8414/UM042_0121.1
MQSKWIWAAAAGLAVYTGATYSTLLLLKSKRCHSGETSDESSCTHDRCRFDALAPIYDSSIGWDEFFMGLPLIRWSHVSKARGNVLEVSAGTGRNFSCYSNDVEHVVFSDVSFDMLRLAKLKWEAVPSHGFSASFMLSDVNSLAATREEEEPTSQRQPFLARLYSFINRVRGLRSLNYASGPASGAVDNGKARPSSTGEASQARQHTEEADARPVERVVLDSEDSIRAAVLAPSVGYSFEGPMFDSVVDTFGLCSCKDPVHALKEMLKVLRPGGRLILLEHGRSSWDFVNNLLDSDAKRHHQNWGCWWNRDILAIVTEAGLEVEFVNRWHFGTTYCIVAKPSWRAAGAHSGVQGSDTAGAES